MNVLVELKEDQGTGKLTSGVVKTILSGGKTHPHGIMVELEDGQIGRVKQISGTNSLLITSKDNTDIAIRPGEDLSNRIKVIDLLSKAKEYIWLSNWYFKKQHFEILHEALEQNKEVSQIRLLFRLGPNIEDFEKVKEYYKLFTKQHKDIETEIRIITNIDLGKEVHDRFYYTKNEAWNFIDLDSVLRNTRAVIHLLPPGDLEKNIEKDFMKYWNAPDTLNLTDHWEDIKNLMIKKKENIEADNDRKSKNNQ